jgi:hypothetical protein
MPHKGYRKPNTRFPEVLKAHWRELKADYRERKKQEEILQKIKQRKLLV